MKKITMLTIALTLSLLGLSNNKKKISKKEVYTELTNLHVISPKIATQIAVLETGLKPRNNNLFGFKVKRYLKYGSWRSATVAFKAWEDKRYNNHIEKYHKSSVCDYYHFIKAMGYVDGKPFSKANDLYVAKLKKISI